MCGLRRYQRAFVRRDTSIRRARRMTCGGTAAHDREPRERPMPDLDEIDRGLIRELQRDARQSNRDLAAAVHVSPSTSSERVRGLKADGIIRGYHADVSLPALGRDVQALTAVTLRPPTRANVEAFRKWVADLPELIGVFVVSGSSDFLLHVAVPDTNALYAFVIDRLTGRPEVADVNTSIVYEHIRRTVLEPA
jgi:DNA-binding Lrp family transcriptional regulator